MTSDELKSLPKGDFIVMKTGVHPMRVHLKLFFKWGIKFDKGNPYTVPENGNRTVRYAEKKEILDGIMKKYHPEMLTEAGTDRSDGGGMTGQADTMDVISSQEQKPHATRPNRAGSRGKGGKPLQMKPPAYREDARAAEEFYAAGTEVKDSAEA